MSIDKNGLRASITWSHCTLISHSNWFISIHTTNVVHAHTICPYSPVHIFKQLPMYGFCHVILPSFVLFLYQFLTLRVGNTFSVFTAKSTKRGFDWLINMVLLIRGDLIGLSTWYLMLLVLVQHKLGLLFLLSDHQFLTISTILPSLYYYYY